jgi:hypothetical protein
VEHVEDLRDDALLNVGLVKKQRTLNRNCKWLFPPITTRIIT